MVNEVQPSQIQELQIRAEKHLQVGQSQAAIDELDRASEDLSAYPILFKLKGIARLMQGNTAEARLIFDQLEGCFGDDPEFLNVYGVTLRKESDFSKAVEIYKRGIEIKPDEPALLSNFGNLLIDLNKFNDAQKLLEKAIKIAPNYSDARQNLARLDRSRGQTQQNSKSSSQSQTTADIANIEKFLSRDEEAAADWLNLAATSKRDKNPEEALMFARKALEAQPDLAAACQVAGEALMSLNRVDDSERLLLYGALLGDDDPNLLANIASIAAQKGHGKLASVILNRILAQAPEHEVSKKNRETLHDQVKQGRYKFRPLV